jgi:hypothetical protein
MDKSPRSMTCPSRSVTLALIAVACLAHCFVTRSLSAAEVKVRTVPLYRLRIEIGSKPDPYLFTTNAVERDSAVTNLSYVYEGVAGYVLPASQQQMHDIVPLYRLFYLGDVQAFHADHFYTTNLKEVEQVVHDKWNPYTNEGVMCMIASRQLPGTVPLHRLLRESLHFYTADEMEYFTALHKNKYKDEGVTGYVWTKEAEVSAEPVVFTVTRKPTAKKP